VSFVLYLNINYLKKILILLINSKMVVYKCIYCEKIFTRKSSLDRHDSLQTCKFFYKKQINELEEKIQNYENELQNKDCKLNE